MGRRSQHTSDELRSLILDAAQTIVADGGLATLSARSVARVIGYAPGTLYNVYENIDDIVLRVEGRILDELCSALDEALEGAEGDEGIRRFADCYLIFALQRPKLWSLLQEHHLPSQAAPPAWYSEKLSAPAERLERLLATSTTSNNAKARKRTAQALWLSIHGISLHATSSKVGLTDSLAGQMMAEILEAFFTRIRSDKPARPKHNGSAAQRSRPLQRN